MLFLFSFKGMGIDMSTLIIRDQNEADFAAVHDLVIAAFKTLPIACGREQYIMDALWRNGSATVALVAEDDGMIVGQAAFSKMKVASDDVGWHGCGPVAVLPARHRQVVAPRPTAINRRSQPPVRRPVGDGRRRGRTGRSTRGHGRPPRAGSRAGHADIVRETIVGARTMG